MKVGVHVQCRQSLLFQYVKHHLLHQKQSRLRHHLCVSSALHRRRQVVRLRLFEDLTMREVADRVGIGVSAAAHRFRQGAGAYERRLKAVLASRGGG